MNRGRELRSPPLVLYLALDSFLVAQVVDILAPGRAQSTFILPAPKGRWCESAFVTFSPEINKEVVTVTQVW